MAAGDSSAEQPSLQQALPPQQGVGSPVVTYTPQPSVPVEPLTANQDSAGSALQHTLVRRETEISTEQEAAATEGVQSSIGVSPEGDLACREGAEAFREAGDAEAPLERGRAAVVNDNRQNGWEDWRDPSCPQVSRQQCTIWEANLS